ncbi:putative gram-negative bacteria-binding 1 precursor protein [Rutstroemia sp. NJR-2017a WRK4]|nr:putative gram-negative bacteria-binding 1 precursor protein [Rutstroemia sp. NJR-2017a WRK4]
MDRQYPTYRGSSSATGAPADAPVDQAVVASGSENPPAADAETPAVKTTPEARTESPSTTPETPGASPAAPDPFATPDDSRPVSSARSNARPAFQQRYFHSRRINKNELDQPWKLVKDPMEKWVTIIPIIGLIMGLAVAGYLVYDGVKSVVQHKYCPVYEDNFANGFNTDIWTKEAEVGGFGNGQFEQTTTTDENVFVENGKLIIRPTLQDENLVYGNTVINLTADGTCSSDILKNCVSITNLTTGTIIQPVKSGRINTKKGATIKYGRVEVTAKIPEGDWIWPAIWMLPVNSTYGAWPLSGEIDIMESRGNNYTYEQGGNNIVSSALHWGPDSANDAWWRTNVKRKALHTTYSAKSHTFGLEWSEKYLFTYIDSRLLQVLYTNFDRPLWRRGKFPAADSNGTRIVDPWSQTGHFQAPFDHQFYLVINVAVGGTNGWFDDGKSGKPWVDASPTAKNDFWNSRDEWLPTWRNNGQMEVSKVKMWQQCDGGELE